MPYQQAVTLRMPVRADRLDALRTELAVLAADPAGNDRLPIGRLRGVHFARFAVIPGATPPGGGEPIGDTLMWAASVDGSRDAHLADVARVGAEGLDRVLAHCAGYPAPADRDARSRHAYLRRHAIPTQAFYANWVGRTVEQVRDEARLRERLETHVDEQRRCGAWHGRGPAAVHAAIRAHVASQPALAWALRPASRPPLLRRAARRARFLGLVALGVVASPVLVPAGLAGLLVIRFKEWQDARHQVVDRRLVCAPRSPRSRTARRRTSSLPSGS